MLGRGRELPLLSLPRSNLAPSLNTNFFPWAKHPAFVAGCHICVSLWRKLSTKELMLLNCGVGEDSWESLGLQGDPASPFWRRSALGFLWRKWCWSWKSSTSATSCEELTHWKRLWCWEGLRAGGEGDDRGWDGWMASPTGWTWVWVDSGGWWWTGRPGVLWFMGSQRVGHDWATELNWRKYILQKGTWCHLVARRTNTEAGKYFSALGIKILFTQIQINTEPGYMSVQ